MNTSAMLLLFELLLSARLIDLSQSRKCNIHTPTNDTVRQATHFEQGDPQCQSRLLSVLSIWEEGRTLPWSLSESSRINSKWGLDSKWGHGVKDACIFFYVVSRNWKTLHSWRKQRLLSDLISRYSDRDWMLVIGDAGILFFAFTGHV